jgi:hypothetical protein
VERQVFILALVARMGEDRYPFHLAADLGTTMYHSMISYGLVSGLVIVIVQDGSVCRKDVGWVSPYPFLGALA